MILLKLIDVCVAALPLGNLVQLPMHGLAASILLVAPLSALLVKPPRCRHMCLMRAAAQVRTSCAFKQRRAAQPWRRTHARCWSSQDPPCYRLARLYPEDDGERKGHAGADFALSCPHRSTPQFRGLANELPQSVLAGCRVCMVRYFTVHLTITMLGRMGQHLSLPSTTAGSCAPVRGCCCQHRQQYHHTAQQQQQQQQHSLRVHAVTVAHCASTQTQQQQQQQYDAPGQPCFHASQPGQHLARPLPRQQQQPGATVPLQNETHIWWSSPADVSAYTAFATSDT